MNAAKSIRMRFIVFPPSYTLILCIYPIPSGIFSANSPRSGIYQPFCPSFVCTANQPSAASDFSTRTKSVATQEQLESMRRYLCSVTEQLNLADWSAKAALTEIAQAIDADGLSEEEKKTTLSGYAALKSLIIKTADFAAANSEVWSAKLAGNYVAASDFGTYLEKTQLTIEGNSVGIKQLYDYTAGVNNAFSVNAQQYIKTGLLYYNDVTPVYGVGVGNIETTVTDGGGRIVDRTKNELLTVTPKRISFWQEGMEVAYLSEKKLHFPRCCRERTMRGS